MAGSSHPPVPTKPMDQLQQPDGTQAAFLNDVIQVRPGKAVTSKDKKDCDTFLCAILSE